MFKSKKLGCFASVKAADRVSQLVVNCQAKLLCTKDMHKTTQEYNKCTRHLINITGGDGVNYGTKQNTAVRRTH